MLQELNKPQDHANVAEVIPFTPMEAVRTIGDITRSNLIDDEVLGGIKRHIASLFGKIDKIKVDSGKEKADKETALKVSTHKKL